MRARSTNGESLNVPAVSVPAAATTPPAAKTRLLPLCRALPAPYRDNEHDRTSHHVMTTGSTITTDANGNADRADRYSRRGDRAALRVRRSLGGMSAGAVLANGCAAYLLEALMLTQPHTYWRASPVVRFVCARAPQPFGTVRGSHGVRRHRRELLETLTVDALPTLTPRLRISGRRRSISQRRRSWRADV